MGGQRGREAGDLFGEAGVNKSGHSAAPPNLRIFGHDVGHVYVFRSVDDWEADIGLQRGVSKGVEDGRRPPTLKRP
jgi:hypothetical protein